LSHPLATPLSRGEPEPAIDKGGALLAVPPKLTGQEGWRRSPPGWLPAPPRCQEAVVAMQPASKGLAPQACPSPKARTSPTPRPQEEAHSHRRLLPYHHHRRAVPSRGLAAPRRLCQKGNLHARGRTPSPPSLPRLCPVVPLAAAERGGQGGGVGSSAGGWVASRVARPKRHRGRSFSCSHHLMKVLYSYLEEYQ
jgi:hypothetical protein